MFCCTKMLKVISFDFIPVRAKEEGQASEQGDTIIIYSTRNERAGYMFEVMSFPNLMLISRP